MLSEEMTGRLVNEIRRFLIADAATLSKAAKKNCGYCRP